MCSEEKENCVVFSTTAQPFEIQIMMQWTTGGLLVVLGISGAQTMFQKTFALCILKNNYAAFEYFLLCFLSICALVYVVAHLTIFIYFHVSYFGGHCHFHNRCLQCPSMILFILRDSAENKCGTCASDPISQRKQNPLFSFWLITCTVTVSLCCV